MRVLYIGYYNEGSTTRMRGEYLKELLPVSSFHVINIDVPLYATNRVFRSLGWRYKIGPLIRNINSFIAVNLKEHNHYDVVWVDKGVFIDPTLLEKLKNCSGIMVHFTPDPAFTYHRSKLFFNGIKHYDFCVTTKSFEVPSYEKYGVRTMLCTQGYDPSIHKPYHSVEEKSGVVFIGHKEDDREYVISKLINRNISVTLAGINWENFAKKNRGNKNLSYLGSGIFAEAYARELSKAKIGLGFISKIIPELHTTRTFEIPACATVLATEVTDDTKKFFNNGEVMFYNETIELPELVEELLNNTEALERISLLGYNKVTNGGYDYKSILSRLLKGMHLLP